MADQTQNPGAVTNSFNKGMVKDFNETFVGEGLWTHARNAVNNSHDGQVGVLGNEPANLKCIDLPYTLIGAILVEDDQWVLFSTDNTHSEIGLFDESRCLYTKIVNADCLNFKTTNLIVGVARKRLGCERLVYWDDALNPSRLLNIDDVPFVTIKQPQVGNSDCIIETKTSELDCEQLRLSPLVSTPKAELKKAKSYGTLPNGSYQVAIAYTVNQVKVTDYYSVGGIQSLFDHNNVSGSLDLNISYLDKNFDEFELVVIYYANGIQTCKRLGYYSTEITTVNIDTIHPTLVEIPFAEIPVTSQIHEKSDGIYEVSNYMLRVGTYSRFDFNYQLLANKIVTKWAAVEYPSNYYYKGGNNVGYMRDEQYAFFIRWVYNTGDRSASYHIPGRSAFPTDTQFVLGDDAYETRELLVENIQQKRYWQVQNTGQMDSISSYNLPDGGKVIASGRMAYWESTEKYPANNPEVWGELCGKNIRHHKFPDETVDPLLKHFNHDGDVIVMMGVSFENISHPVDNNGNPILSIVGYEILRGSREGNKTIVAKGMFNNMREYDIPNTPVRGLYQNYPFNDLRSDYLLTSDLAIIQPDLDTVVSPLGDDSNLAADTNSDDDDDDDDNSWKKQKKADRAQRRQERKESKRRFAEERQRLAGADTSSGNVNLSFPLTGYKSNYLSFHSPDITFNKPFLGINEIKVYQEIHGKASGSFSHPYKHPKFKTVTNFSGIFGSVIGTLAAIGNVLSVIAHDGNITLPGTEKLPYGKKLSLSKLTNFPVGIQAFGTGVTIPNPVIAVENAIIGAYNLTMAVAMSYIEAQAVGEQILNLIYAMIPKRQNAIQYDSHGYYNQGIVNKEGNRRFKVENSFYVDSNLQTFETNYLINNLYRSNFVALKIGDTLSNPSVVDTSRFLISEKGGQLNKTITSTISGYYGSLKTVLASQYGQLESITQIPVSENVHDAKTPTAKYSTGVLFGGDVYINRFTEKNPFFFFNNWLVDADDETEFDYREGINIAYPRFWIDSQRQNFKLFKNVSNHRHLDNRESSIFFVSKGYFYLFFNGVRDFFVESEINLAYRDWGENISQRHYDPYAFTDLTSMFRSDVIKTSNYYKYDYSLSVSKLFNNQVPWGFMLPRDYSPLFYEKCFTYQPNRVAYSLPQTQENKKDNWRIFLTNNYRDFPSKVTSVKNIGKTGALFMFERESPIQFMGVDTLQTEGGIKLVIGDGGLLNPSTPLQSVVNSDKSYQYGSCQNRMAVLGTPQGVFYVSQDQGKIFQFGGQLDEISRSGMKWWLAKYLPSELLKVYPDYPYKDNPVAGVGVQMIYDNTHEIIYITKKDYKPRSSAYLYDKNGFYEVVNGVKSYLPLDGPGFVDASWTLSYDPKNKMFLSFHDWKPSYLLPGKNHFMSVDYDSIWKHNVRCDLFSNFYGKDYPFEIEFVSSTGQTVTTMRNVEYIMEVYKYYNDCSDKFHLLDVNFDQAIIYNSEQVSGLLQLELKDKINPQGLLGFPEIDAKKQRIRIQYAKEENRYRFNQFWDITKNRGEFSEFSAPMFITRPDGYQFEINPDYIDYAKPILEHKKFRHMVNRVWLRKLKSGDNKMLFKLSNQKIQQSFR